jgi:hypothetical protein
MSVGMWRVAIFSPKVVGLNIIENSSMFVDGGMAIFVLLFITS